MPTPELRPPAGHESADVRVVAPINAGQQGAPAKSVSGLPFRAFSASPLFSPSTTGFFRSLLSGSLLRWLV